MNYFEEIFSAVWQIMSIPITIYGFTFTYGQVYIFTTILIFVGIAIFKILWG